MNNILYATEANRIDWVNRIRRHESTIDIAEEMRHRALTKLRAYIDERLTEILLQRLGVEHIWADHLVGRLSIIVSPATGMETYLLDGRPLARVYPITMSTLAGVSTVERHIEELSGE